MRTTKYISFYRYFAVNTTCKIYVASLYKLDDLLPTSITCTVTAVDSGGNTDTTSVVITIGKILFNYFMFHHK